MAQGDSINVQVTDLVEVTFKLDFKKALVQRLPDRDAFVTVVFIMSSPNRSVFLTADPGFMDPAVVTVERDDQDMKVVFSFATPPDRAADGPVFRPGDRVGLLCAYGDRNGQIPSGPGFRPHLLGEAVLLDQPPA